jgi:hypothetical protein
MRAGPLSNEAVIDLLNRYFVPVYVDGVYLAGNEAATAEEKTAYRQLFEEFHRHNDEAQANGAEKLSIGSVHAYILTSDGRVVDSLHVGQAKAGRVAEMLRRAVAALKVEPGEPVVTPAAQSLPPSAPAEILVLHLTARYLVARQSAEASPLAEGQFVPIHNAVLGTERAGNWSDLPSENWIVLAPAEWRRLVPEGDLGAGRSWDIDPEVAAKLYLRFYPDTEANDFSANRIDRQALRAKVVSVNDATVRVRLDGDLKMKHAFYPNHDDDHYVETAVVGYFDYQTARREIRSFRLVTDGATYGSAHRTQHFGAAVDLLP